MNWFRHPVALSFRLTWLLAGVAAGSIFTAKAADSAWVHPGADGRLVYKTTPAGDRIMDFSTAGYMGGGVALPIVPVKETVQPSGGPDDTRNIQAAIDAVSALPFQGGFRGAVLLAPGTFTCSNTIFIMADGVVLRGSGSDPKTGTTIRMVVPRHNAITIGGERSRNLRSSGGPTVNDDDPAPGRTQSIIPEIADQQTTIADAYVPAGTSSFNVANAAGFVVGDSIAIRRPTTEAWVHFMQMDNLVRDDNPQTWIGTSRSLITTRTITSINGNRLTVDIPLADSYYAR